MKYSFWTFCYGHGLELVSCLLEKKIDRELVDNKKNSPLLFNARIISFPIATKLCSR